MTLIYKIVPHAEWADAEREGVYPGSAADRADGFIHFSTASQVAGTAAKHFAGQHDLVLLVADTTSFGDALRWERSPGGDLFPHLYDTLGVDVILRSEPLPVGPDGAHAFEGLL